MVCPKGQIQNSLILKNCCKKHLCINVPTAKANIFWKCTVITKNGMHKHWHLRPASTKGLCWLHTWKINPKRRELTQRLLGTRAVFRTCHFRQNWKLQNTCAMRVNPNSLILKNFVRTIFGLIWLLLNVMEGYNWISAFFLKDWIWMVYFRTPINEGIEVRSIFSSKMSRLRNHSSVGWFSKDWNQLINILGINPFGWHKHSFWPLLTANTKSK